MVGNSHGDENRMLIRMNAGFKFHSVGHGLFYSGVIKAREGSGVPFTFVYDCGGKDPVGRFNKFWAPLKKEHKDIRLTLLVISHFHKDHISGIPNLIKVAKPRFVIMPYLKLAARVACVAALSSDSESKFGSKFEEGDLVELAKFILYPEEYCKEFRCKLFLVDPDELAKEVPDQYDDLVDEQFYGELNFPRENQRMNNRGCWKIRNGAIGFLAGWKFHFFMPKRSAKHKEIVRWLKEKGMSERWLKGCAINGELFAEINAEFGKLDLKSNGSNLVCVHGPVYNVRNGCMCVLARDGVGYSGRLCVRRRGWHAECVMPTGLSARQMLTGDAEFDQNLNFSKWMSDEECNQIALFQVPHHGSLRNREDWFESQLPNCIAWVVPHGFSTRRDLKNLFKINGTTGGWVYYVKHGLNVCLTLLR